ncbi:hypothetical protein BDV10DRAFT_28834 [Aspergillus recurvatus]
MIRPSYPKTGAREMQDLLPRILVFGDAELAFDGTTCPYLPVRESDAKLDLRIPSMLGDELLDGRVDVRHKFVESFKSLNGELETRYRKKRRERPISLAGAVIVLGAEVLRIEGENNEAVLLHFAVKDVKKPPMSFKPGCNLGKPAAHRKPKLWLEITPRTFLDVP